jgi:8-oxo-dGTP pyrophosphatase MutT (NUDIX family)
MYKVFFNDSSIQVGSGIKKSFKDNILPEIGLIRLCSVNQFIDAVEKAHSPLHFYISSRNPEADWNAFRRHFTELPAAGGLAKNELGEVLFIRRLGVWDLPKGKIEKHEAAESAAIREVEEECGLSGLKLVRPLGSTFHIYRSPFLPAESNLVLKETKWFLMRYSGNEKPVPQSEEDIEEVRWIKPGQMAEMVENTYASIREFLSRTLSAI